MVAELVDAKEVAKRLALTPEGVRRLAREEDLPCIRISTRAIRFDWEAVSAWLKGRNEKPTS